MSTIHSHALPPWLRRAVALPNRLYHYGLGDLLGRRFVQITHVGRCSGGWGDDGSPEARRLLAEPLPFVAFRPAG